MKNKERQIVDEQMKVYKDTLLKHGTSPLGIGWNNVETQVLRFERLTRHLDFPAGEKVTIHDVGSGLSDMSDYLSSKGISCDYSGTEIVQEMIDSAKKRNAELKLYNRNILTDEVTDTYDYVLLSGTFNKPGHISEHDWQEFVFSMISKMFSMCNKAVAFNCLTTYKTLTDPELFYLSPETVLGYCMNHLSRFVNIDHSYALYEYTVTVSKKEYVSSLYDAELFGKYFKS